MKYLILLTVFLIGCTDPKKDLDDYADKLFREAEKLRFIQSTCYAIYPPNIPEVPKEDAECLKKLRKENEDAVKKWLKTSDLYPTLLFNRCQRLIDPRDYNEQPRQLCMHNMKEYL